MGRHPRTRAIPLSVQSCTDDDETSTALDQVREQISRFVHDPYLLTVTVGNRPHCATVTAQWDVTGRQLITPAPSSWAGSSEHGYCQVSLVWPPDEPDGYSLIIDGDAHTLLVNGEQMLAVCPTRTVLYRRGAGRPGANASCGADCIPILSL